MTRAELKTAAKQQIQGNIGVLFVISLLTGIIAGTGFGVILVPALSISLCAIYLNMTDGNKAGVGDMFCRISTVGKGLWLNILIAFFISLWSCLFLIPGILKSYSYSMAYYVLADNPELTAREALRTSKRIMKGHKFELFILHLSFFWWHLLGSFTFGLAYIYIIPYMSATVANFYNQIKDKAPAEA